ncbi:MAG: hypothetical protein BroJett011_41950 [Chloroflexota bacterium]|nr:MAG: hypothetical protein BroJett011_41950 [Chloroflexota bacterium]
MMLSLEKLLLAAGMIYLLGFMTPIGLLKLLIKSRDDGYFLSVVLLLLSIPFGALLIAFVS